MMFQQIRDQLITKDLLQQQQIMMETAEKAKQGKFIHLLIHNQTVRVFFFQFIGTAFLLFSAGCVGYLPDYYTPQKDHIHDNNPFKLVYVVIIVYSIICFIGPLTGAHLNPAVTLMAYLERKKSKGQTSVIVAYFSAQFLGALFGSVLSRNIYGNGGTFFEDMPPFFQLLQICSEQLLATFIFLFFILIITTNQTTFVADQAWIHLCIALVYYLCLTLSSKLHLLNPAVVFAVETEALMHGDAKATGIPACLFLMLAQFIGGGLADLVFRKAYIPVYKAWKEGC